MKTTETTNRQHCESIAETLEKIAAGQLYKCFECGEYIDIEDYSDNDDLYEAISYGETCICPVCGHESAFEQVSIYDWLQDALDWDYIISSDREYKACRIMVAFGGPNIYVDTLRGSVDLYWWGESASYDLSSQACYEIDEAMKNLFDC